MFGLVLIRLKLWVALARHNFKWVYIYIYIYTLLTEGVPVNGHIEIQNLTLHVHFLILPILAVMCGNA